MDRRSQAPEKIGVSQGKSTHRTEYSRRIESQSDAKSHRQQDKPAANQRRTSSSNEFKIKPSDTNPHSERQISNEGKRGKTPMEFVPRKASLYEYGASKSGDSSLQVLQPTWRRDSVVSNSSHGQKSHISLQHRQPIPYRYYSKSHLVSVRSLDAGRRQKKIAGGGDPDEESSTVKQPLLGSSGDKKEPTITQTFDKEGREAYNNAYEAIEESYRQKKITFEEFDKATDDLKAAFLQNKNS
jgi:hypothetical protein